MGKTQEEVESTTSSRPLMLRASLTRVLYMSRF